MFFSLWFFFFPVDLSAVDDLFQQGAFGQAYQALQDIVEPDHGSDQWRKWAFLKGSCALELGYAEEALKLLESAHKAFGETSSGQLFHNYARALLQNQNYEMALENAQKAMTLRKNDPAINRLKSMHLVAQCHRKLNQMDQAIALLDQAVTLAKASYKEGHEQIVRELLLRFGFLLDAKDLERAKSESQLLNELSKDKKHPLRFQLLEQLGEFAFKTEDYQGSFLYFEMALEMVESSEPPDLDKRIGLKIKLAEAAFAMDESWRCESHFREIIALLKEAGIPKSRQAGIAFYGLGRIYTEWNNHDDARKAFQEAQKIFFLVQDQRMMLETAKYLNP